MSAIMLFYKEVRALSRETHKDYHLKAVSDFSFASHNHWLPVAGVEFYKAARHYPIVFVKEQEKYNPVLVTGLEPGQNVFVDDQGKWQKDAYLPAFVRRYPFVLADVGAQDKTLTVCIDETYHGWSKKDGEPLFTKEGGNTPFLEEILGFTNNFLVEMKRTAALTEELAKLNLFANRSVKIQGADGNSFNINDVYIIDEEKMSQLDGQELHKLNRAGMLGWIFAHLMSLENLPQLFEQYQSRKKAKEEV